MGSFFADSTSGLFKRGELFLVWKYEVRRARLPYSNAQVASRNARVWRERRWSLNEGQIQNFRGVRVATGSGYTRRGKPAGVAKRVSDLFLKN
jgi:hypothetical protein